MHKPSLVWYTTYPCLVVYRHMLTRHLFILKNRDNIMYDKVYEKTIVQTKAIISLPF